MATVTADGVELFYEAAGAGDPIMLTHGSWTDGRTWEAIVGPLAEDFRVVTWDRRGHSRSQDGDGPGSYREDAADLAALIEHLSDRPVHLVGNSAGGAVVLNLVATRPELVASAAVHEPGLISLLQDIDDEHIAAAVDAETRQMETVRQLIETGDHRNAARYFIDNMAVGPGAWDQFPEPLRAILESNAHTFIQDAREDFDTTSLDVEELAATTVPLLISQGTESPELLRASTQELAHLVPSARLEVFTGAGHIPHRTHPEKYVATLIAFIDQLERLSS
jgi:pimeloyl-ACP methyl ester carboxylesterase